MVERRNSPAGVMTAAYGIDRQNKPHVAFRWRSRALTAADAYRRWCPGPQAPAILDLGAADGATLAEVHRLLSARRSLGVEYAPELIATAAPLPAGCELVAGDATRTHPAVAEGAFDLVLALAVLEHLEDPVRLLEQACRALTPGGLFVATCPSGAWDRVSSVLRLHSDEHHARSFDRALFEDLARRAHLAPVEYRRFMFAPVAFLPYLRVPVSAGLQRVVDAGVAAVGALDFTFVNQLFVARK